LNNINFSNQVSDIEPYLILRGHTGPLFSLATSPDNSNLIYTAGNEGAVKIWKVPRPDEVTQYGDTDYVFNCNVGVFQKPNEVIWDLKHHPRAKLLASLCADANLYLWETASAEDYIQAITGKNIILIKKYF
jgi:striatin 1/3/4